MLTWKTLKWVNNIRTKTTTKIIIQLRDVNRRNGLGKTTKIYFTYLISNPTQRGHRKRMVEIWTKFARFNTTGQRLIDQGWMILKKSWFSNLEILERSQQVNWEKDQVDSTTRTDGLNTENQEPLNRTKTQNNENWNITHPNITKQILIQEDQINLEFIKKLWLKNKTTLPSSRNQNWKKF